MNERLRTGKRKAITTALAAVAFFGVFVFASTALAATAAQVGLAPGLASSFGLATGDIRTIIANIVRIFLGLLGLVAVVLMIYAGFLYMTAGGNEEQVAKAKSIITQATIGLVIIMSSFAIVTYIINTLENAATGGIIDQTQKVNDFGFGDATRGSSALGHGIIAYHYPEPGATDIPRNTKIAITFKKPVRLSTIFKNYDDAGTPTLDDDKVNGQPVCSLVNGTKVCTPVAINTDNIKLIANQSLGTGAPAAPTAPKTAKDMLFEARYPDAGIVTDLVGSATDLGVNFDAGENQTITFRPTAPLGSATAEVNYRVALRGGDNGIKVWVPKPPTPPAGCTGAQCGANAFDDLFVDGSYYWTFTTSTTLDVTPPQVVSVVPSTTADPAARSLDRNQILQIYFDKAIDPTSASGTTAGGFRKITVSACPLSGACASPTEVRGAYVIGNRYRTVEFIPSALCDTGVQTNSCGEPVYCLPANSRLEVTVKAATVGTTPAPPQAALDNGVEDMVGNSLDGNRNGAADGPNDQSGTVRTQKFSLNAPPANLATVSDTVQALYNVGSNVDLKPPEIVSVLPAAGDTSGSPSLGDPYDGGPSKIPASDPITVTWNKTMMVSSMRTGTYPPVVPDPATVMLQAEEFSKGPGTPPARIRIPDPPSFFTSSEVIGTAPNEYSKMYINHRRFFTATDLGYTEDEVAADPLLAPAYVPVIGSQMRDTKQNCFYPSKAGSCGVNSTAPYCCNRTAKGQTDFTASCVLSHP